MNTLKSFYRTFANVLSRLEFVGLVAVRLLVAMVFLQSGLTKWNGWFVFDEQKYDLFLYEFFCPDPVPPGRCCSAIPRRWITLRTLWCRN